MSEHRMSNGQKNKDGKRWYKERANEIKGAAFSSDMFNNEVSEYQKMQVNFDLINNIVSMEDFKYVINPLGGPGEDLPADFTNKDIISPKMKTLVGMEMARPFSYKVTATNPEATTRKEEAKFGMIKEFVVNSIMAPIQQEAEMKYMQQAKGRELTPEETREIQQQIQQEVATRTPEEVETYMNRTHQDPAEALASQLLNYLVQKTDFKRKANKGWTYFLTSAYDLYWVGEVNGDPEIRVINPLRMDFDKSPDVDFVEDGEWAVVEYRMTPSQIAANFGSELTGPQLDMVMANQKGGARIKDEWFNNNQNRDTSSVSVYHVVWKDLHKVGFLQYIDPNTGEVEEKIVQEGYKLSEEIGDIAIKWEWVPQCYETYILPDETYVFMRPVEGQAVDLDNLYNCKLPYYGGVADNLNSTPTSLVDRMKPWQYYYNIIMYRVELLMASDKGKMVLMNINAIPRSMGIDTKKFMYYADALKFAFVNPNEEGNRNVDVTNMAKEIDLSLVSDIQKYIELASYIEEMCGQSVGITDAVTGRTTNDSATNNKLNLQQNSYALEPYFNLHNIVKRNVLTALLEQAKISYANYDGKKLTYVLDDMTKQMLSIDGGLLDNSTYGLFVMNSTKANEAVQLVKEMAHAAQQNQAIALSDIVKVIKAEGIQEAEELLEAGERRKSKEMQEQNLAAIQAQGENDEKTRAHEWEVMAYNRETDLMIEDKKTERDLAKQAMLSMGFNEDKDLDKDGMPDVMEVYRDQRDADIKLRKQDLDERKFEHQKETDKEKLSIDKKKASKGTAK